MPIDKTIKILIKAARAGGQVLMSYWGKELKHKIKSGPGDYQTEADLASEKAILKILQKELPKYNIFSEETGLTDQKSEYTITVDSLDGTYNFFLEIPLFGVIISLRKNNTTLYGVIYEPITHRLFFAQKNKGAYKQINTDKPIRIKVNQQQEFKKSIIALLYSYQTSFQQIQKFYKNLLNLKIRRILEPWTAISFNFLADGKIDAIISANIELHDFLAGKLICQEAGAQITHFGEDSDINPNFVISNQYVHKKIVKSVKPIIL